MTESAGNGGGGVRPFIRAGPEFTRVGVETEVKIPWQTYTRNALVLMIVDTLIWGICWLLAYQAHVNQWSFWYWLTVRWWRWAGTYWVWYIVTLFLCVIGASVPYLYRLVVEQVVKQTPQYTPYPSELGRWRAFERPWVVDEDDSEQDDRPYTVKGTLEVPDRTALYLEFDLEDYNAAFKWHRFCRAVTYRGRNFSYNEAVKRWKLSDGDWDNILGAFVARELVIPAGQRGTPHLKAVGRYWVKLYADTPPPKP